MTSCLQIGIESEKEAAMMFLRGRIDDSRQDRQTGAPGLVGSSERAMAEQRGAR